MKQTTTGTIVTMFLVTSILLTSGCAQKTVQTEAPPSSSPVTAQITPSAPVITTIEPVERPISEEELRSQAQAPSQVRRPGSTEGSLEESASRSESLDTAMASAAGQTGSGFQTQAGAIGDGRSSGSFLSIYFDFDRYSIREDQIDRLRNNAAIMKQEAGIRVRIEGNSDEHGTNEYNMALGERRAMGAKQYLVDLGVDENRLETLSYGEERPLNPEHNEAAWAQNRRGDFVILN